MFETGDQPFPGRKGQVAKEIILYNLAPGVTDEYRAFTAKMASLTSEIHVTFGEQIH